MLTADEIIDALEADSDEFRKFDRIEGAASKRRDLVAFNLLDSLCPGDRKMIAGVGHDVIWLEVSPVDLAGKITPEQAVTLIRCGVWYDVDNESLAMFV